MSNQTDGDQNAEEGLPQHPFVARLKSDGPAEPVQRVITLIGLPGDSDQKGYQRLYLRTSLDFYAQFLLKDVVKGKDGSLSEVIPAGLSPSFPGLETHRVTLGQEATIHYVWVRSPQGPDEWDVDARLGRGLSPGSWPPPTALCLQVPLFHINIPTITHGFCCSA
jgi:hypothetical protein